MNVSGAVAVQCPDLTAPKLAELDPGNGLRYQ